MAYTLSSCAPYASSSFDDFFNSPHGHDDKEYESNNFNTGGRSASTHYGSNTGRSSNNNNYLPPSGNNGGIAAFGKLKKKLSTAVLNVGSTATKFTLKVAATPPRRQQRVRHLDTRSETPPRSTSGGETATTPLSFLLARNTSISNTVTTEDAVIHGMRQSSNGRSNSASSVITPAAAAAASVTPSRRNSRAEIMLNSKGSSSFKQAAMSPYKRMLPPRRYSEQHVIPPPLAEPFTREMKNGINGSSTIRRVSPETIVESGGGTAAAAISSGVINASTVTKDDEDGIFSPITKSTSRSKSINALPFPAPTPPPPTKDEAKTHPFFNTVNNNPRPFSSPSKNRRKRTHVRRNTDDTDMTPTINNLTTCQHSSRRGGGGQRGKTATAYGRKMSAIKKAKGPIDVDAVSITTSSSGGSCSSDSISNNVEENDNSEDNQFLQQIYNLYIVNDDEGTGEAEREGGNACVLDHTAAAATMTQISQNGRRIVPLVDEQQCSMNTATTTLPQRPQYNHSSTKILPITNTAQSFGKDMKSCDVQPPSTMTRLSQESPTPPPTPSPILLNAVENYDSPSSGRTAGVKEGGKERILETSQSLTLEAIQQHDLMYEEKNAINNEEVNHMTATAMFSGRSTPLRNTGASNSSRPPIRPTLSTASTPKSQSTIRNSSASNFATFASASSSRATTPISVTTSGTAANNIVLNKWREQHDAMERWERRKQSNRDDGKVPAMRTSSLSNLPSSSLQPTSSSAADGFSGFGGENFFPFKSFTTLPSPPINRRKSISFFDRKKGHGDANGSSSKMAVIEPTGAIADVHSSKQGSSGSCSGEGFLHARRRSATGSFSFFGYNNNKENVANVSDNAVNVTKEQHQQYQYHRRKSMSNAMAHNEVSHCHGAGDSSSGNTAAANSRIHRRRPSDHTFMVESDTGLEVIPFTAKKGFVHAH